MRKFLVSSTKLSPPTGSSTDPSTESPSPSPLPLDIVLEVDELVFLIEDNQMEVKLRANYEVIRKEEGWGSVCR